MAKDWKPYKDIKIDKRHKPAARKAIAQDVIDFIVKRTLQGKGIDGSQREGEAAKYSEAYKKSLNFNLAGKSKSKVNLRLSFEMLNSIVLRAQEAGKIRVGITKGDKRNTDKAKGNELGTYGQKNPIPGKARPFLDISKSDLKRIEQKYPVDNKSALAEAIAKAAALRKAAEDVADDITT